MNTSEKKGIIEKSKVRKKLAVEERRIAQIRKEELK